MKFLSLPFEDGARLEYRNGFYFKEYLVLVKDSVCISIQRVDKLTLSKMLDIAAKMAEEYEQSINANKETGA
jgi:hypothetical protein